MNHSLRETVNQPAPLDWHMGKGIKGSYAGLILKPKGGSSWRHAPSQNKLLSGPIFVPQGTPLPLKSEERPVMVPKNSMFVFAHNYASPACCPATFSTDSGCVCSTEQQRKLIGVTRGNNKTYPSGSF